MDLSKLSWHDDPVVRLEKLLSPLVRDICFAMLSPAIGDEGDFAGQFRNQIQAASAAIVDIQSDMMLRMNISMTPDEAKIVDDLIVKMDRLSRDLPDLLASEKASPICRRLQQELVPAIDATLDTFRERFIGTVLERQAKHRQAAEAAQNEIHDISRKIFFISINASVEASRVGDQGRGFAVISKEIRELAQRAEASLHELI